MMSEDSDIVNWTRGRRERSPRVDEDFSAVVMERVCALEVRPSIGEKIAAAVRRMVPERQREVVYLGGGVFAGALRVAAILYFVIGALSL